jgi:hypothetical protein
MTPSNAGDRLTAFAQCGTDRHRFRSRRLMRPGEHDRVRRHAQQTKTTKVSTAPAPIVGIPGICAGLTCRIR